MLEKDAIERRRFLLAELQRVGIQWRETYAELQTLEPWRDPLDPEAVVAIRQTLGLTQSEFASACGFARAMSISEIERGITSATGPTRRCMIMLFERFSGKATP